MKRKLTILTLGIVLGLMASGVAYAVQDEHQHVYLCHKTHSESNPWVVQQVNANEEQSHLDNGDFVYLGDFKDNGHPVKDAKEWCAGHVPVPPVTEDTPPIVETPPVPVTVPVLPEQPEPRGK